MHIMERRVDRSASPDRVYRYYSMLMDKIGRPEKQIVHFHSTRGWGLANVLAAMQAGMTNYESTMGGIGGQPANFVDGVPVAGTGAYYYADQSQRLDKRRHICLQMAIQRSGTELVAFQSQTR